MSSSDDDKRRRAAERQRRTRRRRRKGLISTRLDVSDVWPDNLIQAGLLAPELEDDPAAFRSAMEKYLASVEFALVYEK